MRAQAVWTIVRDIIVMLVGAAIALNEEFHSATVHPELLYLAGLLLVTPAGVGAVQLSRGKATPKAEDDTPKSLSESR